MDIDINYLINENKMLKNQLNFLIDCITNQMRSLELLCECTNNELIHKEFLKPYYKKKYKLHLYINDIY
jgi:hypothetical protein